MSICTVTYCATDQDVGSNPFWHTCLLLSRYNEDLNKMEVIENWGFGGVPASSSYSIIRNLKVSLGLDTDLYGNHGLLYKEETRHLERGHGLHGVTFEITDEKFKLLQEKCRKMAAEQDEAINDAVRDLNLKPNTSGKIRNYPFEHESYRIYQYELKRAQEEHRAPRLHEFSLTVWNEPRTCKVQILGLLNDILAPEQLERIAGWHFAIPRLSGKMENIFLHSCGPLHQHKKRSGEIAHYRKDAKLYWTLPPQEMEALSADTTNLFKINTDQCDEVKKIIRQLQSLEWLFRDAVFPDKYADYRAKLVNQITNLYESFAIIEPKKSQVAKNDWTSFWRWLASQPRDVDEKILLDKLAKAKNFINSLYMAIVDGWKFAAMNSERLVAGANSNAEDESDINEDEDLESLASYLTVNQQKKLCKIIGRNYITPCKESCDQTDEQELANFDGLPENGEMPMKEDLSNENVSLRMRSL